MLHMCHENVGYVEQLCQCSWGERLSYESILYEHTLYLYILLIHRNQNLDTTPWENRFYQLFIFNGSQV